MLTIPVRDTIAATRRAAIVRLDLRGGSFRYRAGQAAYLRPHGERKRRPFSIASAPEQTAADGLLEFLVQTDASGDSPIPRAHLEPGTLVDVEGPIGVFRFPAHPAERRFLFIAGGIGIAPLRSMLWHALLTERNGQIAVVYSGRSPDDFAYIDELESLAASGRISLYRTVTRSADRGWTGRRGRIDAACVAPLIAPGETLCFVCGPPALIGELPRLLTALGVRDDQILMEQWETGVERREASGERR